MKTILLVIIASTLLGLAAFFYAKHQQAAADSQKFSDGISHSTFDYSKANPRAADAFGPNK